MRHIGAAGGALGACADDWFPMFEACGLGVRRGTAAGSVPTIVNGYVVPPVVNDPGHVGTLTALAGNCPTGRIGSLARFSWKFDVEAWFVQAAVPGPPDAGPPGVRCA